MTIIVAGTEPLEIGRVYPGPEITKATPVYITRPGRVERCAFRVERAANYAEYAECLMEMYGEAFPSVEQNYPHFYEITVLD